MNINAQVINVYRLCSQTIWHTYDRCLNHYTNDKVLLLGVIHTAGYNVLLPEMQVRSNVTEIG